MDAGACWGFVIVVAIGGRVCGGPAVMGGTDCAGLATIIGVVDTGGDVIFVPAGGGGELAIAGDGLPRA